MRFLILVFLALSACSQAPLKSNSTLTVSGATKDIYQSTLPARGIDYDKTITSLAFGSCANQDEPQPLWLSIQKNSPDLFLFTGDIIYGSSAEQKPIAQQYKKLDQIAEYRAVREKVPFLATWDDHDFGERDGGANYAGKENAKRDFLNYWSYVKNSIPLEQGGIYHSKIIGPKKKSVQIIMLDTRYHRSPLQEQKGHEGTFRSYEPSQDPKATILGEAQWEWLEAQLKRPAEVRFVVSSIQLIANEPKFEKWGNFPKERQRFFDLLKKTRAKNVIVLSGDRHMGMIAKTQVKEFGTLYDISASSINRPSSYSDSDSHYVGPVYSKENYGLAKIDWKKKVVSIDLLDMNNNSVNAVEIKLR